MTNIFTEKQTNNNKNKSVYTLADKTALHVYTQSKAFVIFTHENIGALLSNYSASEYETERDEARDALLSTFAVNPHYTAKLAGDSKYKSEKFTHKATFAVNLDGLTTDDEKRAKFNETLDNVLEALSARALAVVAQRKAEAEAQKQTEADSAQQTAEAQTEAQSEADSAQKQKQKRGQRKAGAKA